jgi:hypothetical protein
MEVWVEAALPNATVLEERTEENEKTESEG